MRAVFTVYMMSVRMSELVLRGSLACRGKNENTGDTLECWT